MLGSVQALIPQESLRHPSLHGFSVIGQLFVGLVCDRIGWKVAPVFTTLLIVLRVGATLGTVAHGAYCSAGDLFWFLTFARGIM